jgi:hypothetical protein
MSAWTLYSLANTKETIAWGRAAYKDKKEKDKITIKIYYVKLLFISKNLSR